ncbi:MAG: TIM barrel protein [Bacilli bacterium]|nr:TIM barrel protein [Bacilli bacterium]
MKSLIAVNNKFMTISPKELIEKIKKTKHVEGVEAYFDYENDHEMFYLNELIDELKENNLILQIHVNINLPYDVQLQYFKHIEKYSEYLGYPINVTIHSIYNEDKKISKEETLKYIGDLVLNTDPNKIIICLENLNDSEGMDRLELEAIEDIVVNDENLYLTYDIGHVLADWADPTDISSYMKEEMRNVHIHTKNYIDDHRPIYEGDMYMNMIIKSILFLININYKYNIVYEYDIYYCKGDTLEERLDDYLSSIDYVSDKYQGV